MNCTNCGSSLSQPTGFCGTCGQMIASSGPPGEAPVDMDATIQFTMPTIEPYQHAADATAQFAAVPKEAAETGSEAAAYTSPVSPFLGYGPPVYEHAPPAYGSPISPAVGYGPPVSPAPGYGPAPVPAYAHQYVAPSGYALPSVPVAGQAYGAPAFGAPAPAPAAAPPAPGYGVPQVYGPPQGMQASYVPYPYGVPARPGSRLSVLAFVLAGIAVLLTPIFGVAAIVLASMARTRGERHGVLAFKLAIIGTSISCVLFAAAMVLQWMGP